MKQNLISIGVAAGALAAVFTVHSLSKESAPFRERRTWEDSFFGAKDTSGQGRIAVNAPAGNRSP